MLIPPAQQHTPKIRDKQWLSPVCDVRTVAAMLKAGVSDPSHRRLLPAVPYQGSKESTEMVDKPLPWEITVVLVTNKLNSTSALSKGLQPQGLASRAINGHPLTKTLERPCLEENTITIGSTPRNSVANFSQGNAHSVSPLVLRYLGRLPPAALQETLVLQPEDFNLQRPAALDHLLLAILAEPPERQVAAGASTCCSQPTTSHSWQRNNQKETHSAPSASPAPPGTRCDLRAAPGKGS